MKVLHIDSGVNCSFCEVKLSKANRITADKIIKEYSKNGNINTRDALIELYRSAIEKHAKSRLMGKPYCEDYKQDLFLNLLTKVEDVKKYGLHPSFILSKFLSRVNPPKSIFDGGMVRLDMMNEEEKQIADDFIG